MRIPNKPYVALYGSQSGGWREQCINLLSGRNLAWYDPTDERWSDISAENGDQRQSLIDGLVAKEMRGLLQANCVIFNLSNGFSYPTTGGRHTTKQGTQESGYSLAARCEL